MRGPRQRRLRPAAWNTCAACPGRCSCTSTRGTAASIGTASGMLGATQRPRSEQPCMASLKRLSFSVGGWGVSGDQAKQWLPSEQEGRRQWRTPIFSRPLRLLGASLHQRWMFALPFRPPTCSTISQPMKKLACVEQCCIAVTAATRRVPHLPVHHRHSLLAVPRFPALHL